MTFFFARSGRIAVAKVFGVSCLYYCCLAMIVDTRAVLRVWLNAFSSVDKTPVLCVHARSFGKNFDVQSNYLKDSVSAGRSQG